MQHNPSAISVLENKVPDRLYGNLCQLALFAQYLIEHHLDEFLELSIQSLRDLEVPLLNHMTLEEGNAVAATSTMEMLTHLVNKDPFVHIQKAIDRWTSNQLPKVERNQIVVTDITLIAYSRKKMFLQFLPRYTQDAEKMISIVEDIDRYILQYTSMAFQAFVSVVDDRIQQHIHQLENSQRLFKQAQALTHIGNYVWDLETQVLSWSDELYRIYELDPAEGTITNRLARELNHPEDQEHISQAMEEARKTLQPFDFNYRIITRSGKIKTLHARGEMQGGVPGKPSKIFGTCQDVSEQKDIETKLLQNQTFIQKIADAIPAIIASYSIHSGKFSFLSGGFKKLLGYEAQRGLEEGVDFFAGLIHPDDLGPIMEQNNQAVQRANQLTIAEDEEIIEFQYRMRHLNGEYRWFITYGTVFSRDANHQVDEVINISLDISEAVKSDQVLLQKTLELQHSNASLEEFAFVTSHDLKEPLRKISTFVDLLLTLKDNRSEKEEKLLQKIISSTERMRQMIDNLLSLSLLSGNKSPEFCDLNVVLSEVLSTFDDQVDVKNCVKSEALPVASIIPSQFVQLFQNLIGNSLKFSRQGIPPEIKITWRFLRDTELTSTNLKKANRYLELVFADNGIGFAEAFNEKIFAIFQRLHHREQYEGTGIGLAICKRVVLNHGGYIKASGIPDQGAIFTVVIPQ